eukprot:334212-Chlamydomonas_euryale.AAC.3
MAAHGAAQGMALQDTARLCMAHGSVLRCMEYGGAELCMAGHGCARQHTVVHRGYCCMRHGVACCGTRLRSQP